jgi:hypothetical protein
MELLLTKHLWSAVGAIVFVLFVRLAVRVLYVLIYRVGSLILLLIDFL